MCFSGDTLFFISKNRMLPKRCVLKSEAVLSILMQINVELPHEKDILNLSVGIEKDILKLA